MKAKMSALLFFIMAATASNLTYAGADDLKWVAQCLIDNQSEGKSVATVGTYCECMNNKMSDNETLSISEWEKTHPKEEAECSAKAGWK